jgi:hypothetical protein
LKGLGSTSNQQGNRGIRSFENTDQDTPFKKSFQGLKMDPSLEQAVVDGLVYGWAGGYCGVVGIMRGTSHFIRRRLVHRGRCAIVCGVGRSALARSLISRVFISKDVELFEGYGFYSSKGLLELAFESESQLRRIDESVFQNCSSLRHIFIPKSVQLLGKSSFYSCSALTGVTFEANSSLQQIERSTFRDCSSLCHVVIPRSVQLLGNSCFSWCKSLAYLAVESDSRLLRIEELALESCLELKSFVIPQSVELIAGSALTGSSIEFLEVAATSQHFVFEDSLLYNTAKTRIICCLNGRISHVQVPNFVEIIGKSSFSHSGGISHISFKNKSNVRRIEDMAFSLSSLAHIEIPKSVEFIGKFCFAWCHSLIQVKFASGSRLSKIEDSTFIDARLRRICVPRSVEAIGEHCFASCKSLDQFIFEKDSVLKRIGQFAFFACFRLRSFVFPGRVGFIDGSAFCVVNLQHVAIESDSSQFVLEGLILHDLSRNAIVRNFSELESIFVEAKIEILAKSCFSSCASLQEVVFESNSRLKLIETAAFTLSSLTNIVIPKSVESIGPSCFACCSNLREVVFEADSLLRIVYEYGFWSCSAVPSIAIPRSVEVIGKGCFSYCGSLKKVTCEPLSRLRIIQDDAFAHTKVSRIMIHGTGEVDVTFSKPGCQIVVRKPGAECAVL